MLAPSLQITVIPGMATATTIAPAVAALLTTTTIPPHRSSRSRRRTTREHPPDTIDDLVMEWKRDHLAQVRPTSHKAMHTLLDDMTLDFSQKLAAHLTSLNIPSTSPTLVSSLPSAESIPALSLDVGSYTSWGSPCSVTSSRFCPSIDIPERRRSRRRSFVPTTPSEVSISDHPLTDSDDEEDEVDVDNVAPVKVEQVSRPQSGSRSRSRPNLASSLQTLKSRALSSLQSFSLQNTFISPSKSDASSSTNNTLWSHPFLFPRLSSEIRPEPFLEPPTVSERHYFNPTVQTLDQQRASYREALHPPASSDATQNATPLIQLRPSKRKSRRSSSEQTCASSDASLDSTQNAAKSSAASGQDPVPAARKREPRENADFLRVVVLEMNMRRCGKLDDDAVGRARIWLPPRRCEGSLASFGHGQGSAGAGAGAVAGAEGGYSSRAAVPARWIGVLADE